MAALLRLGHKYDFARFRDDALSRLKSAFPTTLEGWDEKMPSSGPSRSPSPDGNRVSSYFRSESGTGTSFTYHSSFHILLAA